MEPQSVQQVKKQEKNESRACWSLPCFFWGTVQILGLGCILAPRALFGRQDTNAVPQGVKGFQRSCAQGDKKCAFLFRNDVCDHESDVYKRIRCRMQILDESSSEQGEVSKTSPLDFVKLVKNPNNIYLVQKIDQDQKRIMKLEHVQFGKKKEECRKKRNDECRTCLQNIWVDHVERGPVTDGLVTGEKIKWLKEHTQNIKDSIKQCPSSSQSVE